jgi:hypothetical protein
VKIVPHTELGKTPDTTGLTVNATDICDSDKKVHYGHQYYEINPRKGCTNKPLPRNVTKV